MILLYQSQLSPSVILGDKNLLHKFELMGDFIAKSGNSFKCRLKCYYTNILVNVSYGCCILHGFLDISKLLF